MDCIYNYYYFPKDISQLPSFSDSDIIMFGGKIYKKQDNKQNNKQIIPFQLFLEDFHSLFWFTYRKDFTPILNSNYTSDSGWGCMLRSGQMILAQALSYHLLGKDWNKSPITENTKKIYKEILKNFQDNIESFYSIHNISKFGKIFGKNVGEWYGPSTIAQVLNILIKQNCPPNFSIYVASDSALYLDEITSLCMKDSSNWKSLFILLPLRLGIDSINEVYIPSLKEIFQIPQSLGIIGGKPRSAMYFVAYQDNHIFYLDPHIVQPTYNIDHNTPFLCESFHCSTPKKMPITYMDPSLAIGFYCLDKKDFENFWEHMKQLSKKEHPIVTIQEKAPDYKKNSTNIKKEHLSLSEFEDDIVML